MYGIGPLLPRTYWDVVPTDEGASDVRNFLDEMLARHGTKSVILVCLLDKFILLQSDMSVKVSFGTFFWPPVQEYVDEIIVNLIDKKFPFVGCFDISAVSFI